MKYRNTVISECSKYECPYHGAMTGTILKLTSADLKKNCIVKSKLNFFFLPPLPFQTASRRSELYEVGRFKCDSTHCFHSLILAAFSNSRCYFSNCTEKFLLKKGGGRERKEQFSCILYTFKAMLILHRQCSCAAGTKASWRHAQEETAPR